MKIFPDADGWELSLEPMEAVLLRRSLMELQRHYAVPFDDLPPVLQGYWQGKISREPDDTLEEAALDLTETRGQWRSEREELLKNLIKDLEVKNPKETVALTLQKESSDQFLIVLNDRRLLLSAEHGIEEEEMDGDPRRLENRERRLVLVEMYFLGLLMEQILEVLLREG